MDSTRVLTYNGSLTGFANGSTLVPVSPPYSGSMNISVQVDWAAEATKGYGQAILAIYP